MKEAGDHERADRMTKARILLVDDEPNILSAYRRSLRQHYHISTAESGDDALLLIEKEDTFAVVVSDMQMPGMNGVELLKRVKKASPESVRMMLTGNADQETAIQAVNQGHIFRFLNKPCEPGILSIALAMGVRQHKLIISEKELLEKTLQGSVQMLTELLSLSDPNAFAFTNKVIARLNAVRESMSIVNPWELSVAVMISPIGFLTMPPELKTKVNEGQKLNEEEADTIQAIPAISARLLSNIPRMETVGAIVACGLDSSSGLSDLSAQPEDIAFGVQLLRLLFDLVKEELGGCSVGQGLDRLETSERHNLELLAKVRSALAGKVKASRLGRYVTTDVNIRTLQVGDELSTDVRSIDGRLLLAAGSKISSAFLEKLINYEKFVGIEEPISVVRFIPITNSIPNVQIT